MNGPEKRAKAISRKAEKRKSVIIVEEVVIFPGLVGIILTIILEEMIGAEIVQEVERGDLDIHHKRKGTLLLVTNSDKELDLAQIAEARVTTQENETPPLGKGTRREVIREGGLTREEEGELALLNS